MKAKRFVLSAVAVWMTVVGLSTAATSGAAPGDDESKIQKGFEIAPVPLNLTGKNRALVGMGSYLVNAAGDCNGCHSGPSGEYASGGDPFKGQPQVVNQAAYLSGGTPLFGPFFLPRNLTPDKTGLPEGGASFEEFRTILRTGIDPDRKSTRLNSSHQIISYAVFCLKKKNNNFSNYHTARFIN